MVSPQVISVIVEGVLYGLSLWLFSSTVKALIRGVKYALPDVAAVITLFILGTLHIGVSIAYIHRTSSEVDPSGFQSDKWFSNSKTVILHLSISVANALTIYRVSAVQNITRKSYWREEHHWTLIYLALTWIVPTICAIKTDFALFQGLANDVNWMTLFFVTALICSACAAGYLTYRMGIIHRPGHGLRATSSNWRIMMQLILSSRALYCAFLMIMLILFLQDGHTGVLLVMDMTSSVSYILFSDIVPCDILSDFTGHIASQRLPPSIQLRRPALHWSQPPPITIQSDLPSHHYGGGSPRSSSPESITHSSSTIVLGDAPSMVSPVLSQSESRHPSTLSSAATPASMPPSYHNDTDTDTVVRSRIPSYRSITETIPSYNSPTSSMLPVSPQSRRTSNT